MKPRTATTPTKNQASNPLGNDPKTNPFNTLTNLITSNKFSSSLEEVEEGNLNEHKAINNIESDIKLVSSSSHASTRTQKNRSPTKEARNMTNV